MRRRSVCMHTTKRRQDKGKGKTKGKLGLHAAKTREIK